MIYKSFTLAIVTRLLILILLTVCFCFFLFQNNWIIGVLILIPIFISVWNLIYFMNSINRKVAFFFDAVSNDDTTLHFPEKLRSKSLSTLHKSINQLNNHISNIKIKNEYNERFFREIMKYSATGLMAIDDKGYIELINNSALHLIGMPYISHIHLLKQKNKELFDQLTQLQPGQNNTIKLLHGTDLRLILLKVAHLSFGEQKYRLYSLNDIKAELEENELDSWQKLIRVMTHEIMNSIALLHL